MQITLRNTSVWILFVIGILGTSLVPNSAQAVFLEADRIDADDTSSTIDLWFFEFDADATATIKVNDLGGPPVTGADPDMIIYIDDGTFSNVFAIDTGLGADPSISDLFSAGAYVAVVSNHELTVGEFGPTQLDGALAVGGYDYEFNGPTPVGGNIAINCVLSGNLGGGYSKRVLGQDTCQIPPTNQVTEPAALGLFAAGLLGLITISRRRKARLT